MTIAWRSHLFPSRTQKLSSIALMILGGRLPGKVGRCQFVWWPVQSAGHFYPVIIAWRSHLFPSRTQKLSSIALMILGGRLPGKVGHCWLVVELKNCQKSLKELLTIKSKSANMLNVRYERTEPWKIHSEEIKSRNETISKLVNKLLSFRQFQK